MQYAKESNVAYSHALDDEGKRTLCGKRTSGMEVSDKATEAMCGKCRRKMKKPKG